MVEISDQAGPMVLGNYVLYLPWKLMLVGEVKPILNMRCNDERRKGRSELIVDILGHLILDEVDRMLQLADIVIIASDTAEERIGPDRFRGCLGEVSHHDAVRIRPRS